MGAPSITAIVGEVRGFQRVIENVVKVCPQRGCQNLNEGRAGVMQAIFDRVSWLYVFVHSLLNPRIVAGFLPALVTLSSMDSKSVA